MTTATATTPALVSFDEYNVGGPAHFTTSVFTDGMHWWYVDDYACEEITSIQVFKYTEEATCDNEPVDERLYIAANVESTAQLLF